MKIFSKVRDKEDLKEIFREYYDSTINSYYEPVIQESFNSLSNLDKKKEDNLIILSKCIDSYYDKDDNLVEIGKKLGTLMTSAIFLDKYYEETSSLNDKEFLSLALFCSLEEPENIEYKIKIYNKNILNLLCSKFDDYEDREIVLYAADDGMGKEICNEEDIIKFISEITKEDIPNISKNLMQTNFAKINDEVGEIVI